RQPPPQVKSIAACDGRISAWESPGHRQRGVVEPARASAAAANGSVDARDVAEVAPLHALHAHGTEARGTGNQHLLREIDGWQGAVDRVGDVGLARGADSAAQRLEARH